MKLLAIDTSTQVMSVALLDLETRHLCGEIMINLPQNHSASLMPTVSHILQLTGSSTEELAAISVTSGPGSYTGIRIGVTTAKTLAWAREIPLYSGSSLATLAMNGLRWKGLIVPLIDARRQRVYSGLYQAEEGHLLELLEDQVIPMDEWLVEIKSHHLPVLFLGDVVPFQKKIQGALGEQAHFGTTVENIPRASQLALLGLRKWADQLPSEKETFTPNYCQVTEVEAKLSQKRNPL